VPRPSEQNEIDDGAGPRILPTYRPRYCPRQRPTRHRLRWVQLPAPSLPLPRGPVRMIGQPRNGSAVIHASCGPVVCFANRSNRRRDAVATMTGDAMTVKRPANFLLLTSCTQDAMRRPQNAIGIRPSVGGRTNFSYKFNCRGNFSLADEVWIEARMHDILGLTRKGDNACSQDC
jgi:hypothetical protein